MIIESAIFKDGNTFYASFDDETLCIPESQWEDGDMILFQYEGARFRGTLQQVFKDKDTFQVVNLKKIA
jgi:hypothetical protein